MLSKSLLLFFKEALDLLPKPKKSFKTHLGLAGLIKKYHFIDAAALSC